jgi:hypothetical protein
MYVTGKGIRSQCLFLCHSCGVWCLVLGYLILFIFLQGEERIMDRGGYVSVGSSGILASVAYRFGGFWSATDRIEGCGRLRVVRLPRRLYRVEECYDMAENGIEFGY